MRGDDLVEFIHLPGYVTATKGLLTDEEQRTVEFALARTRTPGR